MKKVVKGFLPSKHVDDVGNLDIVIAVNKQRKKNLMLLAWTGEGFIFVDLTGNDVWDFQIFSNKSEAIKDLLDFNYVNYDVYVLDNLAELKDLL